MLPTNTAAGKNFNRLTFRIFKLELNVRYWHIAHHSSPAVELLRFRIRLIGFFSEGTLEYFAGAAYRQLRTKLDIARILVCGELLFTPVDKVDLAELGTLLQHDERFHFFAEPLIRHADNRTKRYGRVRDDHFLQLARVDVITAAEDHVLFPVDDRKITLVIHHTDVTGMKPAIPKRLRGRVGTLVISLHHIRPADGDLSAFTASDLFIVIAETLYLDAEDRLSDSTWFRRLLEMVECRERRSLRQTVALHYADVELRLERFHNLDRHRSSPRCAALHRLRDLANVVSRFLDIFQDRPVHGRNTDPEIHFLVYHRDQCRFGLESRK